MRPDLRLPRLLAVWAPLAVTFLLITGSTPVINASINRLPGRDHEADLAGFAIFLVCAIVLHSPLFVTREIAIRMSVDRAGSRRALRFCLGCAAVISTVELVFGATPAGAWFIGGFTDQADIIEAAHPAFFLIVPTPFLIAVRGVYQAHQIRVDDTIFVGLGTAVRLALTALVGLTLAPHLAVSGPMLGGLCMTLGVATEAVFTVWRARAVARPAETSHEQPISPIKFGLPLMFANLLGVSAAMFYARIAGLVVEGYEKASLSAFQEVKTLHWLLGAGGFALQSLTTAKVRTAADVRPMVRFGLLIGGCLSALFAIVIFTPLRDWFLIDLMNENPGGDVMRFAIPALWVAILLPAGNAIRFTLRGVLISRGHARAITMTNVATLLILASAIAFEMLPFRHNGAMNAYLYWNFAMVLEIAVLSWAARRGGHDPSPLPPPVRTPRESTAG